MNISAKKRKNALLGKYRIKENEKEYIRKNDAGKNVYLRINYKLNFLR